MNTRRMIDIPIVLCFISQIGFPCGMDHDIQDHSRGKRSCCSSCSTPSFSENSTLTNFSEIYTDRRRSRSPENSDESARKNQENCISGRSIPSETDDRASSPKHKMSSSKGDSGYGDELKNHPGTSCGDQKSKSTHCDRSPQPAKQDNPAKRRRSRGSRGKKDKAKKLPWVPPPLPEHLRPVPKITRIDFPFRGVRNPPCPLQNRFQNDGSFLEVFRQKMQASGAAQQSGEAGHSSGADVEKFTAAVDEPFVMKRRLSKPLKTGMVQKPKKRVDACDPEAKVKDSWSLYMKEVQKYRANKCVNNERACRPLMK